MKKKKNVTYLTHRKKERLN